jgi:hypothetical protein
MLMVTQVEAWPNPGWIALDAMSPLSVYCTLTSISCTCIGVALSDIDGGTVWLVNTDSKAQHLHNDNVVSSEATPQYAMENRMNIHTTLNILHSHLVTRRVHRNQSGTAADAGL